MNSYIAYYKGRQITVEAETSYQAQVKAARLLNAKKTWEVTVYLVKRSDGTDVVHIAEN